MILKHWNNTENSINNKRNNYFVLIFLLCVVAVPNVYATLTSHLYTTGITMEVDRCASAWLIKRFVDKEAVFKFFPNSSLITDGVVFDRPEGKLQRTHTKATFEVILDEYDIKDSRLHDIAGLIHDIEINFWGKKENPESRKFEAEVRGFINSSTTNEECFVLCFPYFDKFLQELEKKN